jgi:hypothetical protein
MELTMMEMYFLLKLDNIVTFFVIIGATLTTVGIFCLLFGPLIVDSMNLSDKPTLKQVKTGIITVCSTILFCFVIATFIPSTKQMAAIIVVPKIINNEKVQQLPEELLNLGIDWLEELKPEKGE